MVAPSVVVKRVAKDALKQNFLKSVVVCCVAVFAFFIMLFTSSLISIFTGEIGYYVSLGFMMYLIFSPLILGVLNYFRRLIFEQNDSALIIFKYFSSADEYRRALHLTAILTIKFVSVAVVLYLPYIIVYILSGEEIYEFFGVSIPQWTSNLWMLNSFLGLLAAFGVAFFMLRYYLAVFIFVSNDEIDPAEAVNMSTIISRRTGADFFGLAISFTPWLLLSIFVAPLIFTLPYFITAYCVHSRFAITMYNGDVDKFNESSTPSFSTDEI